MLKGASSDTSIQIHLDEYRESPTAPARTRRPALIAAEDFTIHFANLAEGQSTKQFSVDEYTDTMTFKLLRGDAPLDQHFRFEDPEPGRHGDYYFVRVEQANSGIAWSSPVWVEDNKED